MTTTLSPQIRLIALIGLLAAAALVVSTQLVFRGMIFSGESEPAAALANVSDAAKKAETAGKPTAAASADATKSAAKADAKKAAPATTTAEADTKSTATKPATKAAKAATATKTATATKANAATKAETATTRPLRTHGLPVPLARALQEHRVVVVSLYAPNAAVDRISRAEAEAGANEVGAGFVTLNALKRRNSEPLAAKLGVLKAPSVLVYTRPAKLFVKLDGFVDVATVAQAADNARL